MLLPNLSPLIHSPTCLLKNRSHTLMKSIVPSLLAAAIGLALVAPLKAQVPQYISYQGRITASGANVAGPTGQFKFAIMNQNGNTTFWSHDESSVNGSEPTSALTLEIRDGLFSVLLGDTAVAGMSPLRQTIFGNANVRLRIWFRKDSSEPTFTLLTPDQKIGAAGYAMMAYSVINGAITDTKLANGTISGAKLQDNAVTVAKISDGAIATLKLSDGAVTTSKLADGAVTAAKLAPGALALPPSLDLGAAGICGLLDLFSTDIGTPGLTLNGCQSEISAFIQTNGVEAVELKAYDYGGLLTLRDPRSRMTLQAGSSVSGGFAQWYNDGGRLTAYVDGSSTAGLAGVGNGYIRVAETNGNSRVELLGNGTGGVIQARNGANTRTVWVDANSPTNGGGEVNVANPGGQTRLFLGGNHNGGGIIYAMDTNGTVTAEIMGAESGSTGGKIRVRQADGTATVSMDGDASGQGGWLAIYNNAGVKTIELDGKTSDGKSRITTHVLEITGGADLSENFDIKAIHDELKAGMIVCIDPANPGQLVTSTKSYDNTVAGIVSGAGGVAPGMLMGQHGTAADGKHPVALTGRVYCWVDAGRGAIRPGDLITTSDTPGHGMKASDPQKSHGAVIGKAMTRLDTGKGLVLVLVSLQ